MCLKKQKTFGIKINLINLISKQIQMIKYQKIARGARLRLATCALILFLLLTQSARAQTMSNDSYKVEMGNLNSIAGESTGSNYNLNITSGETSPGLYSGTNYKLRAGFQYVPRRKGFSFTVSNTRIDFGTLSPTNPVTRTTTLTISNTSASSYQVSASENHPLLVAKTGAIIADTTCDKGNCSESQAAQWSSTLTYGFGYSCGATSIIPQSTNCSSLFKQFADVSKKEKAQIIVNGGKGRNQKATVTYKVNIASSQATGVYSNAITYVATPGF